MVVRSETCLFVFSFTRPLPTISGERAEKGLFCCYTTELHLLPKLIRSTINNYSFKIVLKFKYPEVETN